MFLFGDVERIKDKFVLKLVVRIERFFVKVNVYFLMLIQNKKRLCGFFMVCYVMLVCVGEFFGRQNYEQLCDVVDVERDEFCCVFLWF